MVGKRASLSLLFLAAGVSAQIWQTGDNSTIRDCSQSCKTGQDGEVSCWQGSLNFVERALIAQLRNYIAAQIAYDQWYRYHNKDKTQNYTEVGASIQADFQSQLHKDTSEVLKAEFVQRIAATLSDRIQTIATSPMDNVPLYQCPMDCSEKKQTLELTFILSAVLNLVLAAAVLPVFYRSLRADEDDHPEQSQGLVNQAYSAE